MNRQITALSIIILVFSFTFSAAQTEPIKGARFDTLNSMQNLDLLDHLAETYSAEDGYLVTGPLDPFTAVVGGKPAFTSARILVPDMSAFNLAVRESRKYSIPLDQSGYNGHLYELDWEGGIDSVLVMTFNMNRFLIWLNYTYKLGWRVKASPKLFRYSVIVSRYMGSIDRNIENTELWGHDRFGLPESVSLFAPPPDSVIPGESNYHSLMNSNRTINLPIAPEMPTSLTIDDSIAVWLKENAPREAYTYKAGAVYQEEFKRFLEGGGEYDDMIELNRESFGSLPDGNYYYAVSPAGKVRVIREIPAREAEGIAAATGKEPGPVNESFLFPGEALLSAGKLTIDSNAKNRLVTIIPGSEYYLYSIYDKDIRDNITRRSNKYLTTIGHLLKAFDKSGIDYLGTAVEKFYR